MIADPGPLLAATDELRRAFLATATDLPDPGGGLLPGLAIGDTTAVGGELDAAMKASSLSHLTAVSGANCAVVVGIAWAVASAIGVRRGLRVAAALVTLTGFVVLVTPQASVLRAGVMAGVVLLALALGRPLRGLPVLCLAVLGLLVVDPWLARDYGFALSVLATAGLLVLAGPLAAALSRVAAARSRPRARGADRRPARLPARAADAEPGAAALRGAGEHPRGAGRAARDDPRAGRLPAAAACFPGSGSRSRRSPGCRRAGSRRSPSSSPALPGRAEPVADRRARPRAAHRC